MRRSVYEDWTSEACKTSSIKINSWKSKMIILINLKALKEENIMIIRFDYKLKSIQRTDALKILPKLFMAEEKRL